MWRDCRTKYGIAEAREICTRYLEMQAHTKDEAEIAFCKELSETMTQERNEPIYAKL